MVRAVQVSTQQTAGVQPWWRGERRRAGLAVEARGAGTGATLLDHEGSHLPAVDVFVERARLKCLCSTRDENVYCTEINK